MTQTDLQQVLFNQVKTQLEPDTSLVDEISDLLAVSSDSAYRRLRSETSLTLDEVSKIARHFKISLDGLVNVDTDAVQFSYNRKKPVDFDYSAYLGKLIEDLNVVASAEDKEVIFFAKDFPIFFNFLIPEIGEFKGYFWKKSALQLPSYRDKKFDLDSLDDNNVKQGFDVVKAYQQIPSTEIWNNEVLNSLLNQIEYAYEAGFFTRSAQAFKLLEKAEELLNHFMLQAEYGCKFLYDRDPTDHRHYHLYYNEVMMGDNTLLLRREQDIFTIFTHNIIHNLMTSDPAFCQKTWEVHTNLISRSTLISSSSEKERNKFFNRLRQRIDQTRYRMGG